MLEEAKPVLSRDPVMADLLEKHDPYTETDVDEFERLCISIINQQLSTASASAIKGRVFELIDDEVTPTTVLAAEEHALREAGLSETKVAYLQNAARAFEQNDFTVEGLAYYSNEEVIETLTEITGIGDWTAHMYLIFVLERPDVLPLGDLAIRNGIESLYGTETETESGDGTRSSAATEMTRAEMREIATQWRPYRSVATRYIWAEYESVE